MINKLFCIYAALLIFIGFPSVIFFGYPPTWMGVLELVPILAFLGYNIMGARNEVHK